MPEWASAVIAKAKVAGLLAAAVAAGGVGGAVALTHVAPAASTTQQVVTSTADSSADPETTDAQAGDPETTDAQTGDPETTDAQASDPATADCTAGVKNHGAYVSSVAHSAPHGKGGVHGKAVSAAAKSDCGKHGSDASGGSGDPESGDAQSGDPESGDAQSGGQESGDSGERSGAPTSKPSHTPRAKSHGSAHAQH